MKQVLIAIDQLVNSLLGGWADETLSSRAYRLRDKYPLPEKIINTIFRALGEEDHCYKAYVSEREDRHIAPELRSK